MRHFFLAALVIFLADYTGFGQTSAESFESNPAFITVASSGLGFSVTGTGGGFIAGNTAANAGPAATPFANGSSNAFSVSNGSSQISSADINTAGAGFVALRLRLMAVSLLNPNNGMEDDDIVRVSISPDGGATWYNTLEITGNAAGQSWWGYAATGIAEATYDGNNTPAIVRAGSSGNNSTGPATVIVRGLPVGIANLRIRISMESSNPNEGWVMDDVQVIRLSSGALPVSFAYVQARAEAGKTTISWSNLTETEVDHYAVERSADNRVFEAVSRLQPRANNNTRQDYVFVDQSPLASAFYRIKAVELNAFTKTSTVLYVHNTTYWQEENFQVYPNPVRARIINLKAVSFTEGTYVIQLLTAHGKAVLRKTAQMQRGTYTQSLELPSSVQPGIYLLIVEGTSSKANIKVMVQ
jgi:hypothetical protein